MDSVINCVYYIVIVECLFIELLLSNVFKIIMENICKPSKKCELKKNCWSYFLKFQTDTCKLSRQTREKLFNATEKSVVWSQFCLFESSWSR